MSFSKGFAIGESHDIINYSLNCHKFPLVIIIMNKLLGGGRKQRKRRDGAWCDLDWAHMWRFPSNNCQGRGGMSKKKIKNKKKKLVAGGFVCINGYKRKSSQITRGVKKKWLMG